MFAKATLPEQCSVSKGASYAMGCRNKSGMTLRSWYSIIAKHYPLPSGFSRRIWNLEITKIPATTRPAEFFAFLLKILPPCKGKWPPC